MPNWAAKTKTKESWRAVEGSVENDAGSAFELSTTSFSQKINIYMLLTSNNNTNTE